MQKLLFRLYPVIIALVLALLVLRPILGTGVWYPLHDSTHLVRIILMKSTILAGQIPPVWADTINGGLGYPLFQFYAPLFHTVSTLLSFPIFPLTSAIKVTLFTSIFVGILGVMMFARRWGRLAASVAGVAFALAPYAAINIYVRGAFSEYLSIALLPWVFLTTEKVTSVRRMLIATLILSLFVLSHNLIPLLALPMILVWMIYNNKGNLKLTFGAIIIAMFLSSWFVMPLLFERGFTQADQIARTTDYSLHFVAPWQLWNSTWGFGGSGPGVEDGMSFKLGKIQILLGVIGMIFAFVQKKKSLKLLSLFALISVFLATSYSKVIWDSSSVLQIVQFPWRTLGIITVILSIFAGFAVSRIRNKILRLGGTIIIIATLFFVSYKYFAPQYTAPSPIDKREISEQDLPDIASIVPEYLPVWQTRKNREFAGSTILPRAYYPTWEVTLDGKVVPSYPSVDGKLAFYNPTNSSNYSFRQTHTNLEKIASLISIITLAIMIKIYVKP